MVTFLFVCPFAESTNFANPAQQGTSILGENRCNALQVGYLLD